MNSLQSWAETPSLNINDGDKLHTLKLFSSLEDLQRVANLDASAFGGQVSLDVVTLQEITHHGVVFGEESQFGQLISEAQLVLTAMLDAQETLLRALPSDSAYLEGFATHPEFRSKGLGRVLLLGAEAIARTQGKHYIFATSRLENVASLKTLTDQGYRGVDFDPHYYSAAQTAQGARLILCREVGDADAIKDQSELAISVHAGEASDSAAQRKVQDALRQGYQLTSIGRNLDGGLFTAHFSMRSRK